MTSCPRCGHRFVQVRRALTERQRAVLVEVGRSLRDRHVMPSLRQLARALGRSDSTIHEQLDTLVQKGWLLRDPQGRRGYELACTVEELKL